MKELKSLKIFFSTLAIATLFFLGAVVGSNFVQYKQTFLSTLIIFVCCIASAAIATFTILCEKKIKDKEEKGEEEKNNPAEDSNNETGDIYFSNES